MKGNSMPVSSQDKTIIPYETMVNYFPELHNIHLILQMLDITESNYQLKIFYRFASDPYFVPKDDWPSEEVLHFKLPPNFYKKIQNKIPLFKKAVILYADFFTDLFYKARDFNLYGRPQKLLDFKFDYFVHSTEINKTVPDLINEMLQCNFERKRPPCQQFTTI